MTVKNFDIKKISEIDNAELIKFYRHTFQYGKLDLENYNWRYRTGFNESEPLVLIVNNQICGHAGLLPINLKINDKIEKAIWFTDFYINSKYRGKGFGKLLVEEWMKICPIQITICNDQSLGVFKKLNWSNNDKFIRRLEFRNYLKIIPIFRDANHIYSIDHQLDNLHLKELEKKTLNKIIDLDNLILSKETVGIVRDEKWFEWRVLNCPYKKNIFIFKIEKNFFITHLLIKKNLKILNIIYSTFQLSSSDIQIFLEFSKKNKIDYLSYVSNNKNKLDRFLPWQRKLNFAFKTKNENTTNLII